ncbi:hypothetical protein [Flavobacterium litorale]|uniref:IPExxxVDY family protein n=1 Tax=Flavobacterium litorale TaxID=2856519 RepID=A0ABX8V8G7_9FLAO|nr:hypothetical protein [Flavobacterium litorale]QYJ68807.1 hypothetical protein K1I41_02695 [Flavobacterium litorale]
MKKKELPFTIGEQYELHEFELEGVETVLIGNYEYDVYRCSKKLFCSFNLDGLLDIKLYYNADILARVDYYIKPNSINNFLVNILPSRKEDVTILLKVDRVLKITNTQLRYNLVFDSGLNIG